MSDGSGWYALAGVGVQVLASLVGKVYLGSDSRLIRKVEKEAALADVLTGDAKTVIEQLIEFDVHQLALQRIKRASRKISWSSVTAIVFVALITAGIGWGLAYLALNHGWYWWILFTITTFFGIALAVAGAGQLFEYDDETDPDDTPEGPSSGLNAA
ncbi:hypothetical protein [Mycobacteroides sp. PCS013]|uniref:hypothetical protein n=1 Tax=Mycobacteroides sp. PCS013 TaxID=3074106 RepID=UPI003C2B0F11